MALPGTETSEAMALPSTKTSEAVGLPSTEVSEVVTLHITEVLEVVTLHNTEVSEIVTLYSTETSEAVKLHNSQVSTDSGIRGRETREVTGGRDFDNPYRKKCLLLAYRGLWCDQSGYTLSPRQPQRDELTTLTLVGPTPSSTPVPK